MTHTPELIGHFYKTVRIDMLRSFEAEKLVHAALIELNRTFVDKHGKLTIVEGLPDASAFPGEIETQTTGKLGEQFAFRQTAFRNLGRQFVTVEAAFYA